MCLRVVSTSHKAAVAAFLSGDESLRLVTATVNAIQVSLLPATPVNMYSEQRLSETIG